MKKTSILVKFITVMGDGDNRSLLIEGFAPADIRVLCGGERYEPSSLDGRIFLVKIPLRGKTILIDFVDKEGLPLRVTYDAFSRLANLAGSYCVQNGLLLYRKKYGLVVRNYSRRTHFTSELRMILRIMCNINLDKSLEARRSDSSAKGLAKSFLFIIEAVIRIPESLIVRIGYWVAGLPDKPVWIISDRGGSAGDNGEALFRYINSIGNIKIEPYFAISKGSVDYARMSKIGKVISVGNLWYKIMFLRASKVISSQANIETTNPFFRSQPRFVDLIDSDFVFLQHGVIRHDHSDWLSRYEKNIKLFVTSARKEYDSLFTHPYYYSEREVVLTGLPRFDYLEDTRKNKIIITPTYRAGILRGKTDAFGSRVYDPLFKRTEYFRFYNDLINNPRLLEALDKHDYVVELYIHPNFEKQRCDFSAGGRVVIPDYPYDYSRALSDGALLVSDYSSVTVDFAYLKKPIIYAKFDEDKFYESHTYQKSDFFDDKIDGFGPVAHDQERLVAAIIDNIESGCQMSELYRRRVDDFFYKIDNNNSKRVYDAIFKIEHGL